MNSIIIVEHFDRSDCVVVPLLGKVIAFVTAGHDVPLPVLGCHVVLVEPRLYVHLFGQGWVFDDGLGGVLHALLHAGEACDLERDCGGRVDAEDVVVGELEVVLLGHLGELLEFRALAVLERQNVRHPREMERPGVARQLLERIEQFATLLVCGWDCDRVFEPHLLDVLEGVVQPDAALLALRGRLEQRLHFGFARVIADLVRLADDVFGLHLQFVLFWPLECFE